MSLEIKGKIQKIKAPNLVILEEFVIGCPWDAEHAIVQETSYELRI